jgi:TldD protein
MITIKKKEIDNIINVLNRACKRALAIKLQGQPSPYYSSFLYRLRGYYTASSSYGSVYRTFNTDSADVYSDIRVGSYRYDQTTEGGLRDNSEDMYSYNQVSVPTDTTELRGLETMIWKLTEAKFKESVSAYRDKESEKIRKINQFGRLASFTKLPGIREVAPIKFEKIDEKKLLKLSQKLSLWLSKLPDLATSWVDIDISREIKIFVSSEKRIIALPHQIVSFHGFMKTLSPRGEYLTHNCVIHRVSVNELPSEASLKKILNIKYQQLMASRDGQRLSSFSGPALLMPQPAGLLFHEAIGHRLEGSRLLSLSEGHTFRNHEDKKVLKLPITIRDNPTLESWNGIGCIGAYQFDDEGTQSHDTLLIDKGILKEFLTTRAQIPTKKFRPNGHARNRRYQRPISRMAVTMVESDCGISHDELKKRLLEEIIKQDQPYGVIIYETGNGETDTSTYDFQAFSGQIMFATLLYPNGKEVPIRGVDIVGTPLQALSNIIEVGDKLEVDNSYCGAESGSIPVSTISPAILLSHIELQAKDEELVTPFVLRPPC